MGKIFIKGLKIKAYHGVNPEEKIDGQNFILDITAELDARKAKSSDDVDDTVSYSKMMKTAIAVFTAESYNLIEVAAHKVGMAIMQEYEKLESITVLLKKPEAPIKADFEYVAFEETIKREDLIAEKAE